MEAKRAQEILEASEKITVKFGGKPIWIDSVDVRGGIASIHMVDDPDEKKTVSTDLLNEEGNVH